MEDRCWQLPKPNKAVALATVAAAAVAAARARPSQLVAALPSVDGEDGKSLKKFGSIAADNRNPLSGFDRPATDYPFLAGKLLVEPHRHTLLSFEREEPNSADSSSAEWTIEQVTNKGSDKAFPAKARRFRARWSGTSPPPR